MGQIIKIDLANNNEATRFTGGVANTTRVDGGPNVATFAAAVACKADAEGNIYVTDSVINTGGPSYVRKVTRDGVVSTFLTSPYKPQSLAFDTSGRLLIASAEGARVLKRVDNITTTTLTLATQPSAVISDQFGNMFVVDDDVDTITWIDAQGAVKLIAGAQNIESLIDGIGVNARFADPREVVFDSKGRLFVADFSNRAIRMITWTGV